MQIGIGHDERGVATELRGVKLHIRKRRLDARESRVIQVRLGHGTMISVQFVVENNFQDGGIAVSAVRTNDSNRRDACSTDFSGKA